MNLPHKALLIFAKEVVEKNDHSVKVKCLFPEPPTLAMFIEAAAQASAGFNKEGESAMGFLTMVQNIQRLSTLTHTEYILAITKENEVGPYRKFFFSAYCNTSKGEVVMGNFTLMINP